MLRSVAPGSPPDDPVRGLVPCFIPPRMLQSGASFCRILSVASDAPVRGTGFSPGRSSPRARAELHSAPDAPIRGVMYLTLFAVFGDCVCGALVLFFSRAHCRCSSPAPPLRFAFPPALSSPSLPPSPSFRISLPLLPPPPFVVALLRHALKHLVSTRACCYGLGRAHTFILLLSFLPSLCSCALFSFTSLPLSHALCVAFAYFVTSPLLIVWRTHASSYSYACSLPPSSSHSFCTLVARYLCVSPRVDTVGNAAAISPLAFRRPCRPLGFLSAFTSCHLVPALQTLCFM